METDNVLHLIIVEESRNDAEALANILRNEGYVLRMQFADDLENLQSAVARARPDLVLCSTELDSLQLGEVVSCLGGQDLRAPIIALAGEVDEAAVVKAMQAGAVDMASFDQPEHLCLIVARETRNLQCRHTMGQFKRSYRESEKRCRMLLDSSRDAIAYVHDGMHIYANQSYLDMFGFSDNEDIEGTPIMDVIAPEEHAEFKQFLRNYGKEGSEQALDIECKRGETGSFRAQMEFAPASIEDEPCTQILIRDQSLSKELEKKLQHLSKKDLVTGLYNRHYFMKELELAVEEARAGGQESILLFILLDNYRQLRENVGLAGCDQVVSDIARIIDVQSAEHCIAARFGDTSFTILCNHADASVIESMADTLRAQVEEHIVDVDGQSVTTTCSIGISLINENVPNMQEVVSRADLACEVARSSGGNQVHVHNAVVDEQVGRDREEQWNHLIDLALLENRFHLVFQPIVSLQGDSRERYEVLLRMEGGEGEEILPGQFLSVAEQTGKIALIDRWVISHAIETLAERVLEGNDTVFYIKLAGATLEDQDLPTWISEQLRDRQVPPDRVTFEIAEVDASKHLKHAKWFVQAVRACRCKVSLEHFGSSPNSFQLLKHLSVDYLKIDGSFVHNLMESTDNQAMVKSIIDMAASMHKQCIAEFVEDAGSLTVLFQYGVEFIQGNFLQEPLGALEYDFSEETV